MASALRQVPQAVLFFVKGGYGIRLYVSKLLYLQPDRWYPSFWRCGFCQRFDFFAVFVGKHCNFRVRKNAYSVICNLLLDLREEFGLTYLFISHNLSLIKHITDHMSVMYLGEVRESGRTEEIFENPQTPYTEALMSAILEVNPSKARERIILTGEARSPIDPPDLCRFANRCPKACEKCRTVPLPPAMSVGE